jgi:hypothetical protein
MKQEKNKNLLPLGQSGIGCTKVARTLGERGLLGVFDLKLGIGKGE